MALRLDVAGRVATRHPRELLEREMGPEAAQRLREQYVGIVGREALLERALDLVLKQAEFLNVPCILLKYAALNRMGALRVGARSATDIDVLVPQALAEQFQAALVRDGYREISPPESAHQLPILKDRNGAQIEVHLHLPGLTLGPGQPFARAEDLIAAGLTRRSGNALLPDPVIVTAHAIVHGLVQHARSPHGYSALKMFADLADLEQAGYGAFEKASVFLTDAMTDGDLTSALALARALQKGDLEAAMHGPAGVLLRHSIASQLNHGYATRLLLRMLTQPGPTSVHLTADRLFAALGEVWSLACARVASLRKQV
jgi:hypothetical protein